MKLYYDRLAEAAKAQGEEMMQNPDEINKKVAAKTKQGNQFDVSHGPEKHFAP